MKLSVPFRIHVSSRLRWGAGIAGVLLATIGLATWTLLFLRREAERANTPMTSGVEIPVLDRALLSEFSARVPR